EREWMGRGAFVVDQPWERQLGAAGPAAEPPGGLEHGHGDSLSRQCERGGEPVGPAADDDRTRHGQRGEQRSRAAWTAAKEMRDTRRELLDHGATQLIPRPARQASAGRLVAELDIRRNDARGCGWAC